MWDPDLVGSCSAACILNSGKLTESVEQKSDMIQTTFLNDHSDLCWGKTSRRRQDWKDGDQSG